jgi:hypothetical protein
MDSLPGGGRVGRDGPRQLARFQGKREKRRRGEQTSERRDAGENRRVREVTQGRTDE